MLFLPLETLKQIQVNLANHGKPHQKQGCKNHPQMPGMFFLVLFITVVLPLSKDVLFVTTFQRKA